MTKMAAIMGEEVIETGDFVVNEKDKICLLYTSSGLPLGKSMIWNWRNGAERYFWMQQK